MKLLLLEAIFEHQPLAIQLVRLTLLLLDLSATWYGVSCSELQRAAREVSSADLEDLLRDLMPTTRNQSVAAAEHAEVAAVGALRSSICGLEAQATKAYLAAAATARVYLALLEREGQTAALGGLEDGGCNA